MNQKLKKSSYKAPQSLQDCGNSFVFAFSNKNAKTPKIGQKVVYSEIPQSILLRIIQKMMPMKAGCQSKAKALRKSTSHILDDISIFLISP